MKITATVFILLLAWSPAVAQSEGAPSESTDAMELLAENDDTGAEDDSYLQRLESMRTNPLNLNAAEAEDLYDFHFLNAMQVSNFLKYRKLLGNLIHVYELQAVPGWDLSTIAKILPYITLADQRHVEGWRPYHGPSIRDGAATTPRRSEISWQSWQDVFPV
jgi:hypothetical protein